jgi:uncharacterized protein YjiS (DUF1127 family)
MMSTTYSAPAGRMAGRQFSALPILRQWCLAYMGWRAERAAIAHLQTMSDRDLRDIGLLRTQLAQVERGTLSGWPGSAALLF